MFQVGNPLHPFTRNPNQDDSGDVPSLEESQQKIRNSHKIISTVIQFCLIILIAILVLTIGLFIYNRLQERTLLLGDEEKTTQEFTRETESHWEKETQDGTITIDRIQKEKIIIEQRTEETSLENCSDCISFAELKIKVETNVIEAEEYLRKKILQINKANLDIANDAALTVPEDFPNRLVNLPLLLEKINQLISLNVTFMKAFNEAYASQQELQKLERVYGNKVSGIENLSSDMINYIKATYAFKRLEEESKQNITVLDEQIRDEIHKLEALKKEGKKNIDHIKDQIHNELKEFGIRNEQGLIDRMSEIGSKIENIEKQNVKCEQEILSKNEQIIILETEYNKNTQYLEDIIGQTNQLHWVRHVLATIQKFEEVKRRLESLQKQQLQSGKEHFEKLLDLISQKENNYTALLLAPQPKTVVVKEQKAIKYQNEDHQMITKQQTFAIFEQSTSEKAEILKRSIEKERTLLKVWAFEQFNTYEISKNEINNLTSLIEAQKASIKEHSSDYESYATNVTHYETLIEKIVIELEQQKSTIRNCEETIRNSGSGIIELQTNLEEVEKISKHINESKHTIEEFETDLSEVERIRTDSINNLKKMQKNIQDTLKEMKRNKDSPENHLKILTRTINQKIATGPVPEVVEKKVTEYKVKVEKANEVFQQLSSLIEEIKSIV